MPSEEFFRSLQSIMKMPPEDLPYLHGVIVEQMKLAGLPMTPSGDVINTSDLVKKSVTLLNSKADLTGWEMALLAGVILQYGGFNGGSAGEGTFDSRSITGELRRYEDRTIANITSATDSLRERGLVDEMDSAREKGAHRSFRLNVKGQNEALKLCSRHEKSAAA